MAADRTCHQQDETICIKETGVYNHEMNRKHVYTLVTISLRQTYLHLKGVTLPSTLSFLFAYPPLSIIKEGKPQYSLHLNPFSTAKGKGLGWTSWGISWAVVVRHRGGAV